MSRSRATREKEELQRKVVELERIEIEKRNAEELLTKWQTANLVLHKHSEPLSGHLFLTRTEMIHDIFPLNPIDWTAQKDDWLVYLKIDEDVRFLGEEIISSKQQLRDERHMMAHPTIYTQLKAFLKDLGDGVPTLKPIEIDAFSYLKVTTYTTEHRGESSLASR